MLVVVRPDFLVAIEAQWDAVLLIVGAARGFVDDVGGLDVYPALLEAKAATPVAAGEHRRFHSRIEGHGFSTVGTSNGAGFRRRTWNSCASVGPPDYAPDRSHGNRYADNSTQQTGRRRI